MKKITMLVAFVATFMIGVLAPTTAQAVEKKVGMLPFMTEEFPQLTKQQYLDFLINGKIESGWKFYANKVKTNIQDYADSSKHQVKARIQILTNSTDKISDQELIDFINNKCEIVPVGTKEVINSTALVIDSASGKVLRHALAKQRIGARVNKITKAIEQKLVVKATGDVVSYLSCVNTGTDDPTEVTAETGNSDEGDDDESTEETSVKKSVTASTGKLDININIKNVNKNINTNTNKNENVATTATKSSGWGDDNIDYTNKYAEDETVYVKKSPKKRIVEVEYATTSRKKDCDDCDDYDPTTNKKLDKIIRQNKQGNAAAWLGLGVGIGHWIWDAVTGKKRWVPGSPGTTPGKGGDGDFENILTQQGGFGGDGDFENL